MSRRTTSPCPTHVPVGANGADHLSKDQPKSTLHMIGAVGNLGGLVSQADCGRLASRPGEGGMLRLKYCYNSTDTDRKSEKS